MGWDIGWDALRCRTPKHALARRCACATRAGKGNRDGPPAALRPHAPADARVRCSCRVPARRPPTPWRALATCVIFFRPRPSGARAAQPAAAHSGWQKRQVQVHHDCRTPAARRASRVERVTHHSPDAPAPATPGAPCACLLRPAGLVSLSAAPPRAAAAKAQYMEAPIEAPLSGRSAPLAARRSPFAAWPVSAHFPLGPRLAASLMLSTNLPTLHSVHLPLPRLSRSCPPHPPCAPPRARAANPNPARHTSTAHVLPSRFPMPISDQHPCPIKSRQSRAPAAARLDAHARCRARDVWPGHRAHAPRLAPHPPAPPRLAPPLAPPLTLAHASPVASTTSHPVPPPCTVGASSSAAKPCSTRCPAECPPGPPRPALHAPCSVPFPCDSRDLRFSHHPFAWRSSPTHPHPLLSSSHPPS